MKLIIYFLTISVLITSCKNTDENTLANKKVQTISLAADAKTDAVVKEDAETADAATAKQELISQKIIKEGNIKFETNDLQLTYKKIIDVAKKNNAVLENDIEGKDNQSIFRNVVVRVPSQNFDVFFNEISIGVDYFDRKEISSKDVTEQYIDIDGRLKA